MATKTLRGKAQVSGTAFVADVILYPIAQSLDLTQEFTEQIVEDEQGQDTAWRAYNEKYMGDIGMILIDKSAVGSTTASNAKSGAAFFAPLAIVTISTCDAAAWNTTFQIVSGSKIGNKNTETGTIAFKLRRYADSTQNTLAASTPG